MSTPTDYGPLYRSFIGFDHLAGLIDQASRAEKQSTYPPYNVELLAENLYRITMAVAGFSELDIDIESQNNNLIILGTKLIKTSVNTNKTKVTRKFLHQGIAERNFERKFQLGENVKVIGAFMENGLLQVDLKREVPVALKSRKITINGKSLLSEI